MAVASSTASARTPVSASHWSVAIVHRMLVVAGVSFFLAMLLLALWSVISPMYGYMGFRWDLPSFLIGVMTIMLSLIPALLLPTGYDRPSSFVLWMFYLIVYIPAQVVPRFTDPQDHGFTMFQIWLCLAFVILSTIHWLPLLRIRRPSLSPFLFWFGVFALTGISYLLVLYFYGLPTSVPSLANVYTVRTDFNEATAGVPSIVIYITGWQTKVINPLLFGYGLHRKNLFLISLGLGGQVLMYALAGNKSVLFSFMLVLAVYIGYRHGSKIVSLLITAGATGVVVGGMTVYFLTGYTLPLSLFVRRLMLVPGLLTGYYVDFFSQNPQTHHLEPISRALFENPYQLRTPFIIGRWYFNSDVTSANANFFADGYAAFGIGGMLVVTLLFGALLWLQDALSLDRPPLMAGMLVAVPAFSATNSALFSSLLTHGILVAALLLFLFPTREARPIRPAGKQRTFGHPAAVLPQDTQL